MPVPRRLEHVSWCQGRGQGAHKPQFSKKRNNILYNPDNLEHVTVGIIILMIALLFKNVFLPLGTGQ